MCEKKKSGDNMPKKVSLYIIKIDSSIDVQNIKGH